MAASAYYDSIQKMYMAFYGRPADPTGLETWAKIADKEGGMTLNVLANFIQGAEAQALYGNKSNAEVVNAAYNYLFGRDAEPAALTTWAAGIASPGDMANLLWNIMAGAGGADKVALDSKLAAAKAFTNAIDTTAEIIAFNGDASNAAAREFLASVNDADSLAAAIDPAKLAESVMKATTDSAAFNLTANIDTATANVFNSSPVYTPGGNDFINSLQDEDRLTGTGKNPTLNVTLGSVNDAAEAVITPTMNGIATTNVQVTGSTVQGINFQDATGLENLNVTRITSNNPSITFNELQASVDNMSLSNSTNTGNVTFAHKEEVLTRTTDTLAFAVTNARVNALTLSEGTDGGADAGYYFETINMTSTGTNDLDAVTIQANGREDVLNSLAAGTTTQTYNLTAGAAAGATGSFEVNNFTGNGLEFINITANHRVDIAADKLSALRPQNDGITTNDLEVLTITGGANVMIDGLDTTKQTAANGAKTLTVNAGTMTGNLKLGVASAADNELSSDAATRGDVDLSVTSGFGNDEIRTYTNLAGTITTNDGNDTVTVLSAAAITAAQNTLTTAQTTLATAQAALAANVNPANTVALQTAVTNAQTAVTIAQNAVAAATTASADMEGVSRIVTGEGNDTVGAQDLLAFGDNAVQLRNSGVDNAAQIDTGAGNDTITVRNLANAVNWDDNNPDDANVDDRFAYVGASITAGAGDDTLNISGTMAENTTVDMGTETDTVNYTVSGLADATNVLADDDASAREFVAVNAATTAVDASTADLDGATMNLGAGDDTITFTDSDLAESAVTLVAAAANVANSGAKLMGGDGTDNLIVNTTDNLTVVSAATLLNTAAITGVETITLNINNAVDAATNADTGVAITDTDDMQNTTVTLDVMRVDSALTSIALNSLEQRLMTLAGSEIYESGNDTTFTLNNMRTGIDLTLSAFEATGVVGANNATVAQGARQDDTILSISTTSTNEIVSGAIQQTTNRTDVTLNINYEDARGLNDADSLTINTTESFDLALNLDTAAAIDRVGNAASATDDDARLIENFTLTFSDANAHSVDMMGFGDVGFRGTRAPVATDDVSSTAVTSFTLNSGAAAGQGLDIDNVNADTIRVNNADGTAVTAANVTLRVDASNNYNIATGSGTDIIDMRADDVRSDDNATAVNRADFINAGEGRDTMIINGNDDLGTNDNAGVSPSMIVNDDVFAGLDSIETILVDTFDTVGQGGANGNLMISIDEQAGTGAGNTNVDTIRMIGNQANQLDLVIGNNFTIASTVNTTNIAAGALLIDTAGHTAATTLNIESKDDDTDVQLVNMDIRVAGKGGTNLDIIDAGSQSSTVEVRVYTADEADVLTVAEAATALADGIVNINTGYAGTAETLNKGAFDKLVILEGSTANDNSGGGADGIEAAMTIAIADRWTNNTTGFTVDASAVANTDANLTTGGATITAALNDAAALTISGTANNDVIRGGIAADNISGNAGDDTIVGDQVVNNNELEVVTFAATYDAGDVVTVTHNGNARTATVQAGGATAAQVADAFANGTNAQVTIGGAAFASATAVNAGDNLRLTGATAGTDYIVTATTNNTNDIATTPQIQTITPVGWSAGETLSLSIGGVTYQEANIANTSGTVIDAAGGANGTITFDATYDVGDVVTVQIAGVANTVVSHTVLLGATTGADVATAIATLINADAADWEAGDGDQNGATALGNVVTVVNDNSDNGVIDLTATVSNNFVLATELAQFVTAHGAAINAASGGTLVATATTLTLTGAANGSALTNDVDFGQIIGDAAATVNLALTAATGVPTDQANPTVVTETVARTVTGAADTINGGAGNDTIAGLTGADVLDGGDGVDTLDYSLSLAAVNVNLATNVVSGGDAQGDTITGFESVTGSVYNDTLTGSDVANTITAGRGNDTIDGGAGADVINAGEGSDSVNGGAGIDTITLTETTSVQDTLVSDVTVVANADLVTGFVSGTDKFDYNGTLLNGLGTNTDGIAGTDFVSDTTMVGALGNPNATAAVVFDVTTDANSAAFDAVLGANAAGLAAAYATLEAELIATGALSAAITNLDSVLTTADSALVVLHDTTGTTGSIVLRIMNTDTTVVNTLTGAEVELVGVFTGTQLAAADFI